MRPKIEPTGCYVIITLAALGIVCLVAGCT
jgi:hypothetical protein